MVSNSEIFTDNSPMSSSQYLTVENPSAKKLFCQFLDTLEVKPKTAVCRFCDAESKHKSIRAGIILWSVIPKLHRHTKINKHVKSALQLDYTTSLGCGVSNSK